MRGKPQRRPARRRTRNGGFTLVEMLVVLAVLGIAAAGAMTMMRPIRERSLLARSAAAIGELITRARAAAIRDGKPALVRFDPVQRKITLEGTGLAATLDASIALDLTTAREVGADQEHALLFLPDGTGSGGKLRLRIAGSATSPRTLRVSWLTGAVVDER